MRTIERSVCMLVLVLISLPLRADFPVRSGGMKEWLPAAAYNPDDHEYLVVWSEEMTYVGGIWINGVKGQRVGEDGTLVGSPFVVFQYGVNPMVTYNPKVHEYLVGFNPGSGFVGQRISAGGVLLGSPTTLMNGVSNGRLLYNSINGGYLFVGAMLVETPSGSGYYNIQISTCMIGSYGQQVTSPQLVINTAHGYNPPEPAFGAAFAPIQSPETPVGRYLLAIGRGLLLYMLNSDGAVMNIVSDPYHPGVYYREIPFSAGSPSGGEFHVDVAYGDQSSYSMTGPAFLVVWSDQNNKWNGQAWSGIWGEFLDATKIAYLTTDTVRNYAFPVSAIADHWAYDQHVESWKPKASYNPSSQKFYVAWRETPGTSPYNNATVNHIRGNYVFQKAPPADNVVISATSGTEEPQRPAVAASTTSEYALVVWEDARNASGGMSWDIYGNIQKVADAVEPPPPQYSTVVINTLNSGPGSLRQAILNANAHSGLDTISFSIPGAGPHTIMPLTALPALTDPVVIDGFTQPGSKPNTNLLKDGSNAILKIVLDGSTASGIADGIWLKGGNSRVRGLAINTFSDAAVRIDSVGGNVIEGNYLGTDSWGLVGHDSHFGVTINGVADNLVGGTTPEARNVISGNSSVGVSIYAGASWNIVQGNYIGVNANGTDALGNIGIGVSIYKPARQNTIGGTMPGAGNVISGSGQYPGIGMGIQVVSSDNTISGNYIGTNASGDDSVTNYQIGIFVGGSRNTVGGTSTGARNIISGNALDGLQLYGDSNIVQGNYIGTNASGTSAVPNLNGVRIQNARMNQLGGTASTAANLISANHTTGVLVVGSTAAYNVVAGNKIGTGANGTSQLGNTHYGLVVINEAHHTTIGGTEEESGNIIANNGYEGIAIDPNSTGNRINRNSIYGNGRLGINLVGGNENAEGVTANDLGDGDTGANNLQNFPVIGTLIGGSYLSVSGLLNSTPNATFRVEFFATPTVMPLKYGEGKTFLGWIPVTTDAQGDAPFDATIGAAVGVGQTITATATDADGNTSEFGIPVAVTIVEGPEVVTNTLDSGPGSLRQAMLNANAKAGRDTIAFNIPGAGVHTITPATLLPELTDPVVIDGFTQPGTHANTNALKDPDNAVITILIDGTLLKSSVPEPKGLQIKGGTSCVRGLAMKSFVNGSGLAGAAIEITSKGGNVVEGNHLGTDASGTTGYDGWSGVTIRNVPNNIIGGATAAARNIIFGRCMCVNIENSGASGNVVLGNYLGVDATGNGVFGKNQYGVRIFEAPSNTVGGNTAAAGNVIGGCGDRGTGYFSRGWCIWIGGDTAKGNLIAGNLLGTNAAGTDSLPNTQDGIWIESDGNSVGGTAAGAGNVISGNHLNGICLFKCNSTIVRGNYIGTDRTGSKTIPNGDGIRIEGAQSNQVGDLNPEFANVISGNRASGVVIIGSGASQNVVTGNKIGTGANGASSLGNTSYGVLVITGAHHTTIGGTAEGAGNIIAYNGEEGIVVDGSCTNNRINANSIYGNGRLGIDLWGGNENAEGVTSNDLGDGDTGANNLQNFPLVGTVIGGSYLSVSGLLNSTANATFRIEFFATPTVMPVRYGEGKTYLGWIPVTTDAQGDAPFDLTIGAAIGVGQTITATATDANGNTSEFGIPLPITLVEGAEVVTNTLDSGPGSLRQAILNANAKVGRDTIAFNIPGTGVHTIAPATALPDVIDPAVIDGYTQPGSSVNTNSLNDPDNAVLKIVISGASLPSDSYASGLVLRGGTNCVRGLVINGFRLGAGIRIFGKSGNVLEGNYLGTDADGMTYPAAGSNVDGVWIDTSSYNRIGGTTPDARNIISCNSGCGVSIQEKASKGNVVQGNFIGLNAAGTGGLGNGAYGVNLQSAPANTIGGSASGAGNVISATGYSQGTITAIGAGVFIMGEDAKSNIVSGNLIGTNASGNGALTNSQSGVTIANSARGNIIGGTSAGARNVISGNDREGVQLLSDSNFVRGNYIGTDIAGSKALPNAREGILIDADKNQIGGLSASAGNLISGNGKAGVTVGFWYGNVTKHWNKIQGNRIGTQSDGSSPLGNSGPGILINGLGWDTMIGDTLLNAGNIIAFNGENGIRMNTQTGNAGGTNAPFGNHISGSSIYANGQLGIDLVGGTEDPWGETANDPGDADDGPNGLQNYPVLLSAEGGSSLTVRGSLNSKADAKFMLEFFATPGGSSPRYGMGQTYLGWTAVRTDPTGNATFLVTFNIPVSAGRSITATATDTAGNTSEFSMPLTVTVTGVATNKVVPREFALKQNYPNPFNPITAIRYELPTSAMVTLTVYDMLGRQLAMLTNEIKPPGVHQVEFGGAGLSSGVYLYRLTAGSFVDCKKMAIVK